MEKKSPDCVVYPTSAVPAVTPVREADPTRKPMEYKAVPPARTSRPNAKTLPPPPPPPMPSEDEIATIRR